MNRSTRPSAYPPLPFEVTFDLTDVPSGEGRFDTDIRRVTVVD